MNSLLQQLKNRRLALGFKQKDMLLRVGISRQQYQRLEARGNPRLDTLELIAKGLNSELLLIPKEKLSAVLAVLENEDTEFLRKSSRSRSTEDNKALSDDPWHDLLRDD